MLSKVELILMDRWSSPVVEAVRKQWRGSNTGESSIKISAILAWWMKGRGCGCNE